MNLSDGSHNDSQRTGRLFLFITFAFFTGLTFFSRSIPFFWDSALYCDISHYYYDTDFSSLVPPPALDPAGSPMIYWMYMAAAWKIFGKTLLVSHFVFLPFLLGIAWEYYKLAKRFLAPVLIPPAMLLLMAEPTVSMQSAILSYDVPKAYLFLLALNAVLGKKNFLFSIALCLLALSSTRGMFLTFSLMGIAMYFWRTSGEKKPALNILSFVPCILVLAGWMTHHYHKTGWALFTPDDAYHHQRSILPLSMMFRQCLYVLWEVCDFGRVFIWAFIAAGWILLRYKKRSAPSGLLILLLALPLAVMMITMCPFSIPIGHKYFLVLFLLAPLVALHVAQELNFSKNTVRRGRTPARFFLCLKRKFTVTVSIGVRPNTYVKTLFAFI